MSILSRSKRLAAALSCAALVAALAACGDGETRLDGSSREALQKSAQKVIKSLPADKQKKFGEAIGTVLLAGVEETTFSVLRQGTAEAMKEIHKKTLERLDGKTADEVIALAEELRKKNIMR